MVFGIAVNTTKPNYKVILRTICKNLRRRFSNCSIRIFFNCEKLEDYKHELSFLFIIGGDGTILTNVRVLKDCQIPIVGINYGTLGFLSSVETKDIEIAIDHIKQNKFYVDKRIMLTSFLGYDEIQSKYICLNDIVISRLPLSRLVKFKIFIDGQYYNTFSGDGIIISTPTGSTAYSLSSGGPIVSPNVESIIITPICSHSLNAKSLVISSESTITLEIDKVQDTYCVFDGQKREVLGDNNILKIRKFQKNCSIVRFDFYDYYHVLREKLINRI